MRSKIKAWLNRNKVFFLALGLVAIGVGIVLPILCFAFPPLFVSITGFSIFGVAPLAFLAPLHLPIALTLLGLISTSVTMFGVTLGRIFAEQGIKIASHVKELFGSNDDHVIAKQTPVILEHIKKIDTAHKPQIILPDLDPLSKPRFFFEEQVDGEEEQLSQNGLTLKN